MNGKSLNITEEKISKLKEIIQVWLFLDDKRIVQLLKLGKKG